MDTSAESLPSFVDLLLDAVFLVDVSGKIVNVSAACEGIFGYTPTEMIGQQMIDFVAPEDRIRTRQESVQVMAGRPRIGFENRYIRKDGRRVHLMWSARWVEEQQLRIGVARDVTELKHAQQMQAAIYAISEATHNSTDLAALFREIHQIIAGLVPVSGFAIATFAAGAKQLQLSYQRGFDGQSPPMQDTLILQHCAQAIRAKQLTILTAETPRVPGSDAPPPPPQEKWMTMPLIIQKETVGVMVLKGHPGTTYSLKEKELLHFVSEQVTTAIKRRQVHEKLLYAAQFDELTGLPNRRLFHDRMQSVLSQCRRKKKRMAVLFIDIDRFKQVNDTHGHGAGDYLLQEVARRLKHSLREEDTVARLGGDEFGILLEDVTLDEDASAVADKIRSVLLQPVTIGTKVLRTGASVGIALYPEHGEALELLLKQADESMYVDKKTKVGTTAA